MTQDQHLLERIGSRPEFVGEVWSGPVSVQDIWSGLTSVEDIDAPTEVLVDLRTYDCVGGQ